jgi:dihydrofolate reductase
MSDVVVVNHVSLDGVMQAPARPDEDRRRGFEHGGWAAPNNDEVMGRALGEAMAQSGALLLGRRTYEDLYAVWPKRTDNPFTEVLDKARKYVASTTLEEPLPWSNSILVRGDVADAAAELKAGQEGWVVVLGSGELIESLREAKLIDRYVLMIHPLVLGSGRRLFADGGSFARLRLVDSLTTTRGVLIATYET